MGFACGKKIEKGPDVLFIDRHMVHEVTSPVAFLGLRNRDIKVLFPEKTFVAADHSLKRNQRLRLKIICLKATKSIGK